ncbi:MAG: ABC transporter ATP-binding protein [Clostridiales bacterium]|nr:ABC transporter ATP-binding protein [Clostridiales bacterium]
MNALELRNVRKNYKDFTLDNVSLTLPQGCIMGLIGENGAGKTTAIKLILRMIRKDGGDIRILGQDERADFRAVKEDLGVVLDEVGLPDCLTALQVGNILRHTYKRWDDRLYRDYLRRFSLPDNRPFKDFSRGMKMKLGIAAALSHHPRLLILDEATSGLDPVVRDEALEIFSEFTREANHAVLISSHIVSDLEKLCDYIAFLHKGKLLLCEEKDRLLEQYGMIHCTQEQLAALDRAAVKGKRTAAYGVEAVVRRDLLPTGLQAGPVGIEDLFVYMVKEGN